MDNFLIIGSSLAKQVVQTLKVGKNVENILFKGKIDLEFVKKILILKNKKYATIVYIAGNDLLPTKLHIIDNRKHICLDKFCMDECMQIYASLVNVLSQYTKQVIFVEPPPRATLAIKNSICSFYDNDTAQRFRKVINSLKTNINVGVFSNRSLLGFLKETNSQICAFDNTHFSKEALTIIQKQVITKNFRNEVANFGSIPN